ncbi:MAG: hypothetical protein V4819_22920 [Verrucomicrobiota bacterium]
MLPALAGVLIGPTEAQLVCYEGFGEYGAGAQVESGSNNSSGTGLNGGTGWGGAYDVHNAIKSLVKIENRTPSPVNYANGEVTIPGGTRALRFSDMAHSPTNSFAVQRPLGTVFGAAAGETLWFSVLFRTNNASPLPNQDFFQIGFDDNANAVSGSPRVSIGANTTSITTFPAAFQLFARSTTSIDASANAFHSSLPIAAGVTYLLVGSIQPNAGIYDSVSLFVNPSTLDEPGPPSASITLPSGLTTLSNAFIRTAYLDTGDVYVLDELRIGRDYGSVVQSLRNALQILPAATPGDPPTLRWPASLTGVVLETSTTLAPESWTEVTESYTLSGENLEFPIPIDPEVPRCFFRLRR